MSNYHELIQKLNLAARPNFEKSLEKIIAIWEETKDSEDKYLNFAFLLADKFLFYSELEKEFSEDYHKQNSKDDLQNTNERIFEELYAENYNTCFANPDYAVEIFGNELGEILQAYYTDIRSLTRLSITHKIFGFEFYAKNFIEVYELLKAKSSDADSYKSKINEIYKNFNKDWITVAILERYALDASAFSKLVETADLTDIRYLYQYGMNITANEINTAKFLMEYPKEKVLELAKSMVKAYIRGFELAKKDLTKKKTVSIIYNVGQEIIVRELIKEFAANKLQVILNSAVSTSANKQFDYDHRFDNSLYFDEQYINKMLETQAIVLEELKDIVKLYSGPIYFDKFGEASFNPKQKESCLKLSDEQQKLKQHFGIEMNKLFQKYNPRTETSFSIIGFPVPEIGEQFSEIFEATLDINMIDTIHHEEIQQHIIDELDKAEFVRILGKDGNRTDLMVKMQKLADPNKQTNFVNCGADVNIPVGEVFTSPKLIGTNGVLHVKEIYLNDLRFENLEIEFKDGFVENYSCTNFEDEKDNQSYIQENLLFPHKTLPLGEFAIGTNTKAYVMAQKFDILPIMPILIVEKMGPHFAIGDTCFSWEEDFAIYNPIDGKEITARENEKSELRKTNIQEAYTNCHTDITIPYDELGSIVGITAKNPSTIANFGNEEKAEK